jgi:phage baseplate assembly protein W
MKYNTIGGIQEMAIYRDFTLDQGQYGRAAEYTDSSAIILGIRNILLSRKGNFPFNPSFGMDIERYQFDLLDDVQVAEIKNELFRQISTYMPSFQNVAVDVRRVTNVEGVDADGREMLGISVSSGSGQNTTTSSFLLYKRNGTLSIINETR